MGGAVDDPWPFGLADDLAPVLAQLGDPRRHQHAPDHGALPLPPADGFDAALVPVHRDAPQALTPQYAGGCFLDRLGLGWLQHLLDNVPPARSALAEVLPDDLVAERP